MSLELRLAIGHFDVSVWPTISCVQPLNPERVRALLLAAGGQEVEDGDYRVVGGTFDCRDGYLEYRGPDRRRGVPDVVSSTANELSCMVFHRDQNGLVEAVHPPALAVEQARARVERRRMCWFAEPGAAVDPPRAAGHFAESFGDIGGRVVGVSVRLARPCEPVFPDRCVSCGGERPADRLPVAASVESRWWWVPVLGHLPAEQVTVVLPVCPGCRRRLRVQGIWGAVGGLALGGLAAAAGWWVAAAAGLPRRSHKLIALALLFVPVALVLWLLPPACDVSATAGTLEFEFRDEGYAREFAALNPGAE